MLMTAEHIAATQMFIDANANTFNLQRSARVSDGAGGWTTGTPADVGAQTMRLVGLSQLSTQAERVSADGHIVRATFALVCLPSADIEVGDTFDFEGAVHEVLFVSTHPEWRKRAEVFRHAN
jgi:hypothetical protein